MQVGQWENIRWRKTVPLTKKGRKIKAAMQKTYGEEKGKDVFYKSQNKGTIKGTHKGKRRRKGY
jgi:hypothetical protein